LGLRREYYGSCSIHLQTLTLGTKVTDTSLTCMHSAAFYKKQRRDDWRGKCTQSWPVAGSARASMPAGSTPKLCLGHEVCFGCAATCSWLRLMAHNVTRSRPTDDIYRTKGVSYTTSRGNQDGQDGHALRRGARIGSASRWKWLSGSALASMADIVSQAQAHLRI
jgi:hypothetical protein